MKILHTADWHLGKKLNDFDRFDEQKLVLQEIVTIAQTQNVEVVLIAGDIFDTFNPAVEAVQLFYQTVEALAEGGRRLVVAIAGNHDSPERVEAPTALASKHGILLLGLPDTEPMLSSFPENFNIIHSTKGFVEIQEKSWAYPLRLFLTPYANEVRLRKYLGDNPEKSLRELVSAHWNALADAYADTNGVNVLVTHLFMTQKDSPPVIAEADYEKSTLYVGGAQNFFTADIPPTIQYTALGHLHQQHFIDGHPYKVAYSGSILQYSFSETLQHKFVLIVDIQPNEQPYIQKVPLIAGRNLRRVMASNVSQAIEKLKFYPDEYIELQIEIMQYLSLTDKKMLYETHQRIVELIPIITQNTINQSIQTYLDNKQNLSTLFAQYYSIRAGMSVPDELTLLLEEVIQKVEIN